LKVSALVWRSASLCEKMKIEVLMICEDPTDNRRKMWAAEYEGQNPHDVENVPAGKVRVSWGRIDYGHNKVASDLIRFAKQRQEYAFDNDEKALAFIDKKVREKASKNYQTVVHEQDGMPITFLCDRQPDEHGFVEMQTWNGKK